MVMRIDKKYSHVQDIRNIDWKKINNIKIYSILNHKQTNHKYDKDKPYSHHLKMVYGFGLKYNYLLDDDELFLALSACWSHDLIEDCRVNYNDLKSMFGEEIAEIVYSLTNEKGRNRKERANRKYYQGIMENNISTFVKVCDRLANMTYSKDSGSTMYNKYKKENNEFIDLLFKYRFYDMFVELKRL
jgi:(p)ppGpp synthase/HD superfamily hydrolase